jgi:hypothetical protein
MKHNKFPQHQIQKQTVALLSTSTASSKQPTTDFVPSPDEVARKAYFSYVNEGCRQGRDVQHWLEAESQLTAERNLTRVHGFHNQT